MPALAQPNSYDLSQSLPTMPTAAPAAPAPLSGRALTLMQSNAAMPAHPFDWAGRTGGGGASPFVPPVRPAAPVAPVALGRGAPPETGGAMLPLGSGAPPETGMGPAALNVIPGGVPGAITPSEVPGMLHPADHAIAYAQHLARQQDAAAFNGSNVNEITTLDANSPRMAAAPNVIHGGVAPTPTVMGGGQVLHPGDVGGPAAAGVGGGMNLLQYRAMAPALEARAAATQFNPTMTIPNKMMAIHQRMLNDALATETDPLKRQKLMDDNDLWLEGMYNKQLGIMMNLPKLTR